MKENTQVAVTFDKVSKAFGEKKILTDFSCCFEKGSRTAVLAPSGRGKTTLLRLIAGIEKPESGRILYSSLPEVSMVFQENRLLDYTTPLHNLKAVLPAGLYTEGNLIQELEAVGLKGAAYEKIPALSGGMKRRVAIVRAMLMPGNLLLLDEPFKGLDLECKNKVMEYVKERIYGRTIFLVSHDQREPDFFSMRKLEL